MIFFGRKETTTTRLVLVIVVATISLALVQADDYLNRSFGDEDGIRKTPMTELDILIKEVEWAEAAARRQGIIYAASKHQEPEIVRQWTLHALFDDLLKVPSTQ
jgi:hypothetical protein